jgi:hypothetical protein
MTINRIHRLDKIVLPGSVEICQVDSTKWDAGIDSLIGRPAGHTAPMFRANQAQKSLVTFSTSQLATLLAACGVNGLACTSAVDTYFKKATVTSSVARATTDHERLQIPQSLLYWNSITLDHNGISKADCTLIASYDGTNDIVIWTGSVALPGNLTAAEQYGCGPLYINGVAIQGIQRARIQSGLKTIQEGDASELWDSVVAVEEIEPVVEIETIQPINWGTLGLEGSALDGVTGLELWARKYAANSSRVANATPEHIKFTGLLGSVIPVDSDGRDTNPITDTLRCELVAPDDSTLPLTINTAAAIT